MNKLIGILFRLIKQKIIARNKIKQHGNKQK